MATAKKVNVKSGLAKIEITSVASVKEDLRTAIEKGTVTRKLGAALLVLKSALDPKTIKDLYKVIDGWVGDGEFVNVGGITLKKVNKSVEVTPAKITNPSQGYVKLKRKLAKEQKALEEYQSTVDLQALEVKKIVEQMDALAKADPDMGYVPAAMKTVRGYYKAQ